MVLCQGQRRQYRIDLDIDALPREKMEVEFDEVDTAVRKITFLPRKNPQYHVFLEDESVISGFDDKCASLVAGGWDRVENDG